MRPANGSARVLNTKMESRLGRGDFALDAVAFVVGRRVARCLAAQRGRRENLDQEIQDRVAADIVQRGAQHHRKDALVSNCLAQPFLQILDRQRALLEKFLHQLVVALGDHLHQCFVRGLGLARPAPREFPRSLALPSPSGV